MSKGAKLPRHRLFISLQKLIFSRTLPTCIIEVLFVHTTTTFTPAASTAKKTQSAAFSFPLFPHSCLFAYLKHKTFESGLRTQCTLIDFEFTKLGKPEFFIFNFSGSSLVSVSFTELMLSQFWSNLRQARLFSTSSSSLSSGIYIFRVQVRVAALILVTQTSTV